ncbi:MAG TPA: DUF3800 domain-containing protein [Terracidiphilus sp.]|nr:DUF3800 domain-containing protein [Terracidiphilus sp.]
MLQGYADDSGSDGKRMPYVLAGLVLPVEQWAQFADDWKAQLARSPAIEYFKMFEAVERIGQFQGVQPEIRDRKIRDLLEVVDAHKPKGIYSVLRWDEFRTIMAPTLTGYLTNPYPYLFGLLFDALAKYQRDAGIFPEETDFDFDEQGEAGKYCLSTYDKLKSALTEGAPENSRMMGRIPMMLNDKRVLPLQVADMFAWAMRRYRDPTAEKSKWQWVIDRFILHAGWGMQYDASSFRFLLEEKKKWLDGNSMSPGVC